MIYSYSYSHSYSGVWLHGSSSNDTDNNLLICSAVNDNGNYCVTSGAVPLGHWTRVEIRQLKVSSSYKYLVKVNDITIEEVYNKKPREFSNVKVYNGDPWSDAAQGVIRNLTVTSGEHLVKLVKITSKLFAVISCTSMTDCHA